MIQLSWSYVLASKVNPFLGANVPINPRDNNSLCYRHKRIKYYYHRKVILLSRWSEISWPIPFLLWDVQLGTIAKSGNLQILKEMALRVPEQKFWEHFYKSTIPQKWLNCLLFLFQVFTPLGPGRPSGPRRIVIFPWNNDFSRDLVISPVSRHFPYSKVSRNSKTTKSLEVFKEFGQFSCF